MLYLIIIIAFLGLVIGKILRHYTLEEVVKGKKYLFILSKIILMSVILGTIYFLIPFSLFYLLGFLIGVLIAYLFNKIYLYLGLLLFSSFLVNNNYLLLISSLIFIYGLVKGSYIIKSREILINFILFLLPFLLYIIKSQLISYNFLIISFAIGCLFKLLTSKDL